MIENLYELYEKSDSTDRLEGRLAYQRYNAMCTEVARMFEYPQYKVIAVFAALSPSNAYARNVDDLLKVVISHREKIDINKVTVATYNHCKLRAYSYLEGVRFLETVKGPKIRNFYKNILDPDDPEPVTIDGHAVNMWRGKKVNLKEAATDGDFKYNLLAKDFKQVARDKGLLPNQLQAILWFTWKRIHNIVYSPPQYHLFKDVSDDLWSTNIDLEFVAQKIKVRLEKII